MEEIVNEWSDQGELIVFYADDDQDDLENFRDAISEVEERAVLYTHDRGDNLLHAISNPPPAAQIVFLDLNMPGMNGFDVLAEIRQINDARHLPVVILSTSDDEQTIEECHKLGANYYIPKPNNFRQLKQSIRQAMHIDWAKVSYDLNNFVYKN